MKAIPFLSLTLLFLNGIHALGAAAQPSPGEAMMHMLLKREAARLDQTYLAGVTNRQQWEAKRGQLRQEYMEMLGLHPLPERTPLNAKVTGVIEREEGFKVEKLHFQSRPDLYVTGNLYLPKDAKPGAKLPAVLYVCGHSPRERDGNKTAYQHHGIWFATHGYACLMIDTLQLGEIAAIHHGTYRYNRWWWQARGYTPAGVECWNGIRAIDYLQSRPEVDPERIAVTGISGGGAATFWIAAADERVKVAVPVSGMDDLEDYAGEKIVNGHCDCMFMINTFQWPWTHIAALIAPRPLLFENSGHDTIFPMAGNDRIRARLEQVYGLYTNRTDRLFDIGVVPGDHEDKVELRLMAYRWINRFLKGDNKPVTEPEIAPIAGKLLRAFPDELPADEINTRIDELFVPLAEAKAPSTAGELAQWRSDKMAELRRLVFRGVPVPKLSGEIKLERQAAGGAVETEPDISIPWKYFPGEADSRTIWLGVMEESPEAVPEWLAKAAGSDGVLLMAPRGWGAARINEAHPYPIQRSLPLLGRTLDGCRLSDVAVVAAHVLDQFGASLKLKIAGKGQAGIIAAYAALLEPRIAEAALAEPPASHREGPIFLNVLRVIDVPEALALLAPRPLTIYGASGAFEKTAALCRLGGGSCALKP